MKEKEFKRQVEDLFKILGKTKPIKFIKIWGGGYFQKPGIPDYICCINGIYIEVELKGDRGKVSKTQRENLILTNKSNGLGILLYPAGLDNFKKIIEKVCEINGHIKLLEVIKNTYTDPGCQILLREKNSYL